MPCPDKLKVECWGHRVRIFRNLDKPEMLITYESELLGKRAMGDSRKQGTGAILHSNDKYTFTLE